MAMLAGCNIFVLLLIVLMANIGFVKSTIASSADGARASTTMEGGDGAAAQIEIDGALITPAPLRPGEGLAATPIGGLIAFSLKAAQARLSTLVASSSWRVDDPEMFTLAGITRPEGVVVDRDAQDVILIGRSKVGDAPLTLDDLVVALRARRIIGKWPVVSIDPPSDMHEGDLQAVRFEGGIENTQLGADLLDADHRLKRMAFGLLPTGVPGLESTFLRRLARDRASGVHQNRNVLIRYWFEPVQDRVIVRDDVVQLGPMAVSVFTEVLSVNIDGKPIDPVSFHDEDSNSFAAAIGSNFDDVALAHPSIGRLRGVNGLVAVVAGLERVAELPSLDYWLQGYAVREVRTLPKVRVIRREAKTFAGQGTYLTSTQGGVELRAIALALNNGDVSALRRAVIAVRPTPASMSWRLVIGDWVIPLSPGVLAPAALGPLHTQADFLLKQSRWDDAIAILNAIIQSAPDDLESLYSRGVAWFRKDKFDFAIADYDAVLKIDSKSVDALSARGTARSSIGQWDQAILDYDEAIRLNPNFIAAYYNRGLNYARKGELSRAIQDYDQAIHISPGFSDAFSARGNAYRQRSQLHLAIEDFDKAIRLNPNNIAALNGRASVYLQIGKSTLAIQDFDHVVRLKPGDAASYLNRGAAYVESTQSDQAIGDFGRAIQIDPSLAHAYHNRGIMYSRMGQTDRALQDFDQAIQLEPNSDQTLISRGAAYARTGLLDSALQDFDRAIQLAPDNATAFRNRAAVLFKTGQRAKAEADTDMAKRLELMLPNRPDSPK